VEGSGKDSRQEMGRNDSVTRPSWAPPEPAFRDRYEGMSMNAGQSLTREEPVSTFSIDVDTASYANVRRFLKWRTLPPQGRRADSELINLFRLCLPQPKAACPLLDAGGK